MSVRTQKANKAVSDAWKREAELVNQGKGTREWSIQEQNDIIERGKAYDMDGKAYQGHHMKSVALFPEYQQNPDNIQFDPPKKTL